MRRIEYFIRTGLLVLALLLLQATFVPFIGIGTTLPDLLLIWLVLIALRRGQVEATVSGFVVGLLQDMVATKFLGLAALAKTVTGFTIGYFHNENTTEATLSSYRFVMLVLLGGMVHNVIYFLIFLQGAGGSLFFDTLLLSAGVAVYSAVISILPMFVFSRRYQTTIPR